MAFERGLIEDGKTFMKAIKSRQLTSHTYNEDTADEIYKDIIHEYAPAFNILSEILEKEKQKEEK